MKSRWFQLAVQIPVVIGFLAAISLGLIGAQNPGRSIAPVLTWSIWWIGVIFAVFFAGSRSPPASGPPTPRFPRTPSSLDSVPWFHRLVPTVRHYSVLAGHHALRSRIIPRPDEPPQPKQLALFIPHASLAPHSAQDQPVSCSRQRPLPAGAPASRAATRASL